MKYFIYIRAYWIFVMTHEYNLLFIMKVNYTEHAV